MSLRLRQVVTLCLLTSLPVLLVAARAVAQEKPVNPLPLKKVVLFNSGVGYFQHDAQLEGTRQVDLKFNVDDINDLLKSMVLQDLGGGRISTVTYGSMDPITRTLKTFAIDLTSNPTMADLLGQVRGEKVEVEAVGNSKLAGTILGLEKRRQRAGKDEIVESDFLNLLTDRGMRSIDLSSVQSIRLLNADLDGELRQALTVLALGHSTDKKTVSLNFLGEGKRDVRVGYIQESPIWKTSYRLVLADDAEPFLQGWAIVENTTEEDWDNVDLTLVSGRPISFVMNLYQPLYVPRPMVEPELFASLRPQTYGQDLDRTEREFAEKAKSLSDGSDRQLAERRRAVAPGAPAPAAAAGAPADAYYLRKATEQQDKQALQLARGVDSVAEAGNVGELFQYAIDTPVKLPRQQSAMLPIVQGKVKGEKLSIYNPRVHAKHPLNGLKLVNSTGLHLMQGPITVFDDGAYAGDARIEDLQPGAERLISYAMDLDTEVASQPGKQTGDLVSVRLVKGTVLTTHKMFRSLQYTVKNSGKKSKQVLIEYPFEPSWKLLAPEKPAEKTRDMYRFLVQAEPGKPAKLSVDEEQITSQQLAATNLPDATIQLYISSKVVSDSVKSALAEVIRRKQALEQVTGEMQRTTQQIAAIDQEQARIRQNMAQLDRQSDLYSRYVKKFGEQEDTIEKLRANIMELQERIAGLKRDLDDYLRDLNVT